MRTAFVAIALVVTLNVSSPAFAQEPIRARTYSGQEVLLHKDGTWKPALDQNNTARTVTLLSRAKYQDYEKATFSFVPGIRDDPGLKITRNDWDLMFDNGNGRLDVDFGLDDRNRILDLGAQSLDGIGEVPVVEPLGERQREMGIVPKQGHVYLVRVKDDDSDLYALFRVDWLEPGDSIVISWKVVPAPTPRQ